ncbi:hypothetical protein ACQQ2N_04940 [Dokdonella sp. MW10]|uniref:hypothetical protein n=1 Tax=Dokdonella sp. MW10 TaxID=2992926 RepID=UPI003F806AD6
MATMLVSTVAGAVEFAPPDAERPELVLRWWDGVITQVGSVTACLSDPPLVQPRTMGYTGYTLLPPNFNPAVGEVFYTHLVLSHPGNPCAPSAVGLELILPPGVTTAASTQNPAFCFARLPATQSNPVPRVINFENEPDYGCPQVFPVGFEGVRVMPPRGTAGGAWLMHFGFWIELLIPLRASQPQPGSTQIRWRVNPDVGVVGYPAVNLMVTNEVIFRSALEDNQLTLDVCRVAPIALGC